MIMKTFIYGLTEHKVKLQQKQEKTKMLKTKTLIF